MLSKLEAAAEKLAEKIKIQKEVDVHNVKMLETRGRKTIYGQHLNKYIGFTCTEEQFKKLETMAKEAKIDKSILLRQLVFGE